MTDDELMEAFENCTLRAEQFRHADHVRVGFLYMSRFRGLEGVRRFSEGLKKLAVALGKANLYHETVTWAFLLLIGERLARRLQDHRGTPSWEDFAAANIDLMTWEDNVLKKYYTEETLQSEFARTTFRLPDRILSPACAPMRE